MADLDKLVTLLKTEEGDIPYVYLDSRGYSTIGCGICIDRRNSTGLTQAERDYLLRNRLATTEAALSASLPFWNDLSEARQLALVDAGFNLGATGFMQFKNAIACMAAGDFAGAAKNFKTNPDGSTTPWYRQEPRRVISIARRLLNDTYV